MKYDQALYTVPIEPTEDESISFYKPKYVYSWRLEVWYRKLIYECPLTGKSVPLELEAAVLSMLGDVDG